jgi:hypothetical protein
MVIVTPQSEIDAYFASPAVNQSTLKALEGGFEGYKAAQAKWEKESEGPEKEHFIIGGGVDLILTGDPKEFDKKYYCSDLEKKPSDVEVAMIQQVFDELESNNIEIDLPLSGYSDMLAIAAVDQEWYGGKPGEKRLGTLMEKGAEYFEDLKKAIGKTVITATIKNKIDAIVMSLSTNDKTKKYFDRETQSMIPYMDFYYQLPIYFTYEGVECKALLDLVVVTHNDKGEVIKVEGIDLKTMAFSTLQFASAMRQRRYDLQAAWYKRALKACFGDKPVYSRFKFIVESTTFVGQPLVFEITEETENHGEFGEPAGTFKAIDSERVFIQNEVKGYSQLMQDYIYYEDRDWLQDRILNENPGIIQLDFKKGILSA